MTIPPTGDIEVSGVPNIGAQLFAVTAPAELTLAANRTGSTSFTVTNLTGRPVKVRLIPRGQAGALDAWLSVVGAKEVPMAVGATITATVQVQVPPEVPAGAHGLLLEVVPEDNTESVTGQSVAFAVPPVTVTRKRFPWWILIVAAVGMALIIGLVVFLLTRGDRPGQPQPEASTLTSIAPTPPAIEVPNFIFMTVGDAYAQALWIGLKPVAKPVDESCGESRVVDQDIPAGQLVVPETTIVFSVTYAPGACFPSHFPSNLPTRR
jgi:PASTA domain-containing protein